MNKLSRGVSLSVTILACALSGAFSPALAQTTNDPNKAAPDTVAPTGRPNSSAPSLPSTTAPASAASSPFAGVTAFGQTLKDKGIYLQLGYNEIVLANVSGGKERGVMPTGELFFGTCLILRPCLASPGLHSILPSTNVMDTTSMELPEPRDRCNRTAVLHERSACRSFSGNKASITTASISPPAAPTHSRLRDIRHRLPVRQQHYLRAARKLVLQQQQHSLSHVGLGWPLQRRSRPECLYPGWRL